VPHRPSTAFQHDGAPPAPRDEERSHVSEVKLTAEARNEFGKGASRRLRRASKIPAVLYGHGTDPVHVSLPGHATMLALKQSNTLLTLDLGGGETTLALPKDVQRDPLRGDIEHVDLVIVRRGERVTVDIQVNVVGDAAPDTRVQVELNTLSIEVEATVIPTSVDVDVTGAVAGTQVHASQVALPQGAQLAGDPEAIVLVVSSASGATDEEADAEAAEAEGAGGAAS
jgi:large subunit ribosomal protein L25